MKALCYHSKKDVRVETVPDPQIQDPKDVVVRVTSTAICGSDLHLYGGFVLGLKRGDILGHEFMGEVVETGSAVTRLKTGDRVVVPFTIACGECSQCRRGYFSVCETTNPKRKLGELAFGHSTAGLFGYTHLTGGYPGGQAEYVRVPHADVGAIKIESGLTDEQVLFLGDIFPTGWQAVVQCDVQATDTVAIWGAGPVGQFCVRSAILLGAAQVICIDRVLDRLSMARAGGAVTIDLETESVLDRLNELTSGRGPDKCIDAVGLEAHTTASLDSMYDRVKQAAMLETDRPHVLREMMYVCRPGGVLSVPGVYTSSTRCRWGRS